MAAFGTDTQVLLKRPQTTMKKKLRNWSECRSRSTSGLKFRIGVVARLLNTPSDGYYASFVFEICNIAAFTAMRFGLGTLIANVHSLEIRNSRLVKSAACLMSVVVAYDIPVGVGCRPKQSVHNRSYSAINEETTSNHQFWIVLCQREMQLFGGLFQTMFVEFSRSQRSIYLSKRKYSTLF